MARQVGSKAAFSVAPSEKHMSACARDTGAKRPEWMLDRSKLPKRPPGKEGQR